MTRYGRRRPRPAPPVNPFRFAVLSAQDAADRGANVQAGAKVQELTRSDGIWSAKIRDEEVTAQVVIDTCGLLGRAKVDQRTLFVSLVNGEQETPTSAIFSVPYSDGLKLIGTETAADFDTLWTSEEVSVPADPTAGFAISEDAPKAITTHCVAACDARLLAENVVAELSPFVQMIGKKWTQHTVLPGGDFHAPFALEMLSDLKAQHPHADENLVTRLFYAYGTAADALLKDSTASAPDAAFLPAEIDYLREKEWVTTSDQVLWRRSSVGARASTAVVDALDSALAK